MADDTKKTSFADRFKKGGGFAGTTGSGVNFANRLRPDKANSNNNNEDKFSEIKNKKSGNKSFTDKKGIKKQNTDDMSRAEQVRRKRSQNVFLVRGKDRNRSAWHYVLVDNNKRELFLAATRSGSLDVADYGEVLESGWGEDPPKSVVKRIEDEFNL
ncbi:MAG: hypothetical protein HRK26_04525 [Rickettsiaceae bacterium H1]|nr:hypothetical protein [Rickettsiaceae bacterium H1]